MDNPCNPNPNRRQIDLYRKAYTEARARFPGDGPHSRDLRRTYVARYVEGADVPIVAAAAGGWRVRPDWAETLNRLAFGGETEISVCQT